MQTRTISLGSAAALLSLVTLGCLRPPSEAGSRELPVAVQMGSHGAALESVQLARLERLFPGGVQLTRPAHLDSRAWAEGFPRGKLPSQAEIDLGKRLFFDPRLSLDGSVSCATCHDVTRAFADRRPVSEGIHGQLGRRNAPTVMNAALLRPLFWDGRAADAAEQAVMPLLNPVEMGFEDEAAVVARVSSIEEYRSAFEVLFPDGVTFANLGQALGAFEHTLLFLDAPFDRFLAGDQAAISSAAQAGWELFNGQGRCNTCHPLSAGEPLGTDQRFHNLGVSENTPDFEALAQQALAALSDQNDSAALDRLALSTDLSELGRFMISKQRADLGAFKTPQLRNVALTQPYMHSGAHITLWDVLDHLNKGGNHSDYLDAEVQPLNLSDEQIDQLVEFLFTLTDVRFEQFNRDVYSQQKERAALRRPQRAREHPTR
jgi:cytochrome c peroxidase